MRTLSGPPHWKLKPLRSEESYLSFINEYSCSYNTIVEQWKHFAFISIPLSLFLSICYPFSISILIVSVVETRKFNYVDRNEGVIRIYIHLSYFDILFLIRVHDQLLICARSSYHHELICRQRSNRRMRWNFSRHNSKLKLFQSACCATDRIILARYWGTKAYEFN